jgi:hypothetical protein
MSHTQLSDIALAPAVTASPDPPVAQGSPYSTDAVSSFWDFEAAGGLFALADMPAAAAFLAREGFVVIANVLDASANAAALAALAADVAEISPGAAAAVALADLPEAALPTSPNRSFRTSCNIAFGRFAAAVRGAPGVRAAFAALHGVAPAALACSWDNPFFTPAESAAASAQPRGLPLHWDANAYYGGARAPHADDRCVQGVFYATATGADSPTFVCAPRSHELWQAFCEDDANPSKLGARVLHYLPLAHFGDARAAALGLARPVRVHVPARSLLLWDARTAHGNAPPAAPPPLGARPRGRTAFAVCYSPVAQRDAATHKEALLKGWAGVRTTHNPAIMLAHDRHGYPPGFVSFAEPNAALRDIALKTGAAINEAAFQEMLVRASVPAALGLTLATAQRRAFDDYWLSRDGTFGALRRLRFADLRALLHEDVGATQGVHAAEAEEH